MTSSATGPVKQNMQSLEAQDSREADARPMVLHARVVTSTGGGPDKTILNSPRFLEELGYDALCAFFHPPGDEGFGVLRERSREWGAPLVEIVDRGKLDWRAIRQAIALCRKRRVALWHAHDYKTNLIGLIVRQFHPMKLVTTAHGWVNFAGTTPVYYWLDKRWWLRRYERVICVSPSVFEECRRAGVPESQCVLIENAIDDEQFGRTRSVVEAKREHWNAAEDQLVIGAIGRLAEEKGFDRLIDAFRGLISRGTDARLVIAGEGPDEAVLRRRIEASGVGDRIELVGFCRDTRGFLESIDLFVLSSLREGLPNVLLEAMAVGVPVIATRVGGVERLVEDGVSGCLIPAGDTSAIERAVARLMNDSRLREKLAAGGIDTVAAKWSFRRRMSRIADLYRDLLSV